MVVIRGISLPRYFLMTMLTFITSFVSVYPPLPYWLLPPYDNCIQTTFNSFQLVKGGVWNILLRGEPYKFWSDMVRIINENTWITLSILCVKIIRRLVLGVKRGRELFHIRAQRQQMKVRRKSLSGEKKGVFLLENSINAFYSTCRTSKIWAMADQLSSSFRPHTLVASGLIH
jgi:hypothetical protein